MIFIFIVSYGVYIMPRQPTTIYQNPDGLLPRATTRHALGNRNYPTVGSSALRVFLVDGNLNAGSRLAIKTDGTFNFGAPDRRWNSLSIIGDSVRENGLVNPWLQNKSAGVYLGGRSVSNDGTANDPNSLWDGVVGVKKVAGGRGALSHSLRGYGLGTFRTAAEGGYTLWPAAFSGPDRKAPPGELLYATWTKKTYSNIHKTMLVAYSNLVGSFQTGSNGIPNVVNGLEMLELGERMTLVGGVGGSVSGYVRYVDTTAQRVYFEVDQPNTWSMVNFTGGVITGQVSGATLSLDTATYYGSEGSQKDCRILEAVANDNGGVIGILSSSIRAYTSNSYLLNGNVTSNTATNFNMIPPREWHRITVWADYRNTGSNYGKMGLIINGQMVTMSPEVTNRNGTVGPIVANWGSECSIPNGLAADYGELVTYTDIFSVLISDSPTWGGVDHLTAEPQLLLKGRTETQAYLNVNPGAMSTVTNKYLYALSAPDTVLNTNGILLSF